jgi:hypothetical protein
MRLTRVVKRRGAFVTDTILSKDNVGAKPFNEKMADSSARTMDGQPFAIVTGRWS